MLIQTLTNSFGSDFLSVCGKNMGNNEDDGKFSALMDRLANTNQNGSVKASVSISTKVSLVRKPTDDFINANATGQNSSDKNSLVTKASQTAQQTKTVDNNGIQSKSETTTVDGQQRPEDAEKMEAAETTDELSKEEIEKIASVFVQIEIVIVQVLQISPEELQAGMQALGMNYQDLVNEGSLKDLFAYFKSDNNLLNLLNDNDLLNYCNDMLAKVEEVLTDNGFTFETVMQKLESFEMSPEFEDYELLASVTKKEEIFVTADGGKHFVSKTDRVTKESDEKEVTIDFKNAAKEHEVVAKSESSSSKGNDSNAFDNNAEMAQTFFNNMIEVVTAGADISETMNLVSQIREITDQILDQIKVNVTPETKSLEIVLTPEALGKVNVTLQENNGVITAKFQTENAVTKEAIESNMQQFKESLEAKGITVSEIEVTVSDFSFNRNTESNENQSQQSGKNKRHFSLEEINEKLDGNEVVAQNFIDDGLSTVSYRA